MVRILVAYPAHDEVKAMFAYDLARLTGFIGVSMMPQIVSRMNLLCVNGTLIAPQRRDIAATALANDYTHILWLDGDMRFPKDTLSRLLKHNKPIVGASYPGRRSPFGTTAYRYNDTSKPEVVYTYSWSTGLEKVDVLGMGCLLTEVEVFRKVPQPWFPIQWGQVNGEWQIHGEDAGFLEWAAKAGYDIYLDHDLSKEVKHIGQIEYEMEHAIILKDDLRAQGRYTVPETPDGPKPKLVLEA